MRGLNCVPLYLLGSNMFTLPCDSFSDIKAGGVPTFPSNLSYKSGKSHHKNATIYGVTALPNVVNLIMCRKST